MRGSDSVGAGFKKSRDAYGGGRELKRYQLQQKLVVHTEKMRHLKNNKIVHAFCVGAVQRWHQQAKHDIKGGRRTRLRIADRRRQEAGRRQKDNFNLRPHTNALQH